MADDESRFALTDEILPVDDQYLIAWFFANGLESVGAGYSQERRKVEVLFQRTEATKQLQDAYYENSLIQKFVAALDRTWALIKQKKRGEEL